MPAPMTTKPRSPADILARVLGPLVVCAYGGCKARASLRRKHCLKHLAMRREYYKRGKK
jgi:hypothetical protein